MRRAWIDTAGERLAIESDLPWVAELIEEGAGGQLRTDPAPGASLRIRVERDRRAFPTRGWELLTRGAWRRDHELVVENACTAGFDVHVACAPEGATLTFRWRPSARDRAAAVALRSRFHLLARAVLIQYPALWWAGTRGRAPLHASAWTDGERTPLVAAAGGVGRSSLMLRALDAGAGATGDNLAVGDGVTLWGLVEPLRVDGAGGRRMPHGRGEAPMRARVEALDPDTVVILRRTVDRGARLQPCDQAAAVRSLITGTYMAGELRRYWALAATLAAGTGAGPAHPPVAAAAATFAARLSCFSLTIGSGSRPLLGELLRSVTEEVRS